MGRIRGLTLIRSDRIRGGAHTWLVYYVFVVYVVIRIRGCSVVRRGGIYTSWVVYVVEL